LSGVSFDSLLNFIRPNISPFSIRFDLGVARTAELTSRILQPSICFAGQQNRFREPVRAAPFDSMCNQLYAFTLTPATLALRVEAITWIKSITRRHRRRVTRIQSGSALLVGARAAAYRGRSFSRAEATRRVERIRRRRVRRRAFRAAARSAARSAGRGGCARGTGRPVAGPNGEAISAAAREWPLLFLGCTKREWLSAAPGGIVPARPGPCRPRPSRPCHSKPPSGSRDP